MKTGPFQLHHWTFLSSGWLIKLEIIFLLGERESVCLAFEANLHSGTHSSWLFLMNYYFWLHWVIVDICRLFLATTSWGYSSLQSRDSRLTGFSSCNTWAQQLWCMGWVALQHVESSWTRDWTMSSALAGGFFSTVPPPLLHFFLVFFVLRFFFKCSLSSDFLRALVKSNL